LLTVGVAAVGVAAVGVAAVISGSVPRARYIDQTALRVCSSCAATKFEGSFAATVVELKYGAAGVVAKPLALELSGSGWA
jgi:hypothetical protein